MLRSHRLGAGTVYLIPFVLLVLLFLRNVLELLILVSFLMCNDDYLNRAPVSAANVACMRFIV